MELPSLDRQPVSPEACADHSSATGLVSGKGECCSSSSGAAIGAGKFIPTRVLVLAACAALNSCNLGFDIGVNTAVGPTLQQGMSLSDQQLEMFMGALNLFAIVGALFASLISDQLGRRGAFAVAAIGFITGIGLEYSASSYGWLMFGRIFVGLGVGFGLAIDPVYIAEIAPPSHRGMLVTWSEIATNIGINLGFIVGYALSDLDCDAGWRTMLGAGAVLPVVMLVLVGVVMPESPRWLVRKGRVEEAKAVLVTLYQPGTDVDQVVVSIEEALAAETRESGSVTWAMLLKPSPALKRMLLVGIGVAISQQVVGIDAVQYFMLFILKEAGIHSKSEQFHYLILLGALKLGVIVVAGSLFDRKGRRPLMFISCAGMVSALLLLGGYLLTAEGSTHTDSVGPVCMGQLAVVADDLGGGGGGGGGGGSGSGSGGGAFVAVFALAMYLCFFSMGAGPGCWLIPSEVFSNAIRAKAMSLATLSNRVVGTIMSSSFLTIAGVLSYGGTMFLFAGITAGVMAFYHRYLPETKGRSLEDMLAYFEELTADETRAKNEKRAAAGGDESLLASPPRQEQSPLAAVATSETA